MTRSRGSRRGRTHGGGGASGGDELVEMDEDEENLLLYSELSQELMNGDGGELKHLLNAECTHCWKYRI